MKVIINLIGEISSTHVFVFITALLVLYLVWPDSTFKRLGIPGPKPLPFLGNFLEFKKGLTVVDMNWIKRYGKIMGYFEGARPCLLVADIEFIKEIGVKQFSFFSNRRSSKLKNRPFDKSLIALKGDHWKYVRSLITPTFSAGKMKKVSPLIVKTSENLLKMMKEYSDQDKPANVKELYGMFVMDSVGAVAFNLDLDSKKDHTFVKNAKELIKFKFYSFIGIAILLFPKLFVPICNKLDISLFARKPVNFFIDTINQAIRLKCNDKEKRIDFLQMMMNAHMTQDNTSEKGDILDSERDQALFDTENYSNRHIITERNVVSGHKNGLEMDELYAQSLAFFLAGYETTSALLGFLSYVLATNSEVQEKLVAEVDEITADNPNVVYETVAKMPYLDMVVCETLRMYPPATRTDRECKEDCTINGVSIPQGMLINISIWAVHYDENLWPEPEKFIPERFSKEEREKRNPYAWLPFGIGPRNCVGMRFALLETKIALVKVLQKFTFEPCAETEMPPKLGTSGFLTPPNGFTLNLQSRD